MRLMQSLVAVAMLPPACALAATHERLSFAPEPAWVVPIAAHTNTLVKTNAGEISLLCDWQVNVETQEKFHRVVRKFVNPSGVQNGSRISLEFEPTYQRLILHRIEIQRGNETLNRLAPENIQVLQREENLESHMYDGELSVVAILNDVRVGDQIDYSYTVRGKNPVFQGKFAIQLSSAVLKMCNSFASEHSGRSPAR